MIYDTQNNIEGYSNINWINNDLSSLDLTDFYTFGDDRISKNNIFDEAGVDHYVTSSIYDKYDNLWIGMNTGAVYKVEDSSYEINRLNVGPRLDFYQIFLMIKMAIGILWIIILNEQEKLIQVLMAIFYQYGMKMITVGNIFKKMKICF